MILRRAISLLLSLLLLAGSTGISLHGHYCKSQLRKLGLFLAPESCHASADHCEGHAAPKPERRSCCKLPNEKPAAPLATAAADGCCSNKAQVLQLDTDLTLSPSAPQVPVLPVAVPVTLQPVQVQMEAQALVPFSEKDHPPPGGREALRLYSLIRC